MEISSLLNSSARIVAQDERNAGQNRNLQLRDTSHRPLPPSTEKGHAVNEAFAFAFGQETTAALQRRSQRQPVRDAHGWDSGTTKGRHDASLASTSTYLLTSRSRTPSSLSIEHRPDQDTLLYNNPLRPSPLGIHDDYHQYHKPHVSEDTYQKQYRHDSARSSPSSVAATANLPSNPASSAASPATHAVQVVSAARDGIMDSPTNSLSAFASVAIEDRLRSGYDPAPRSGHSRTNSQLSAMEYRHDRMMDSDDGSLSPTSSTASFGSERPTSSVSEHLKRFKSRRPHRSSFGSDTPSDTSEVMRIPSLLGSPPRSLPPPHHGRDDEGFGDDSGPRCSYTDNCTTGSPLRKVVSHIFGRNKLCTRQIPKNVWVHYCRKHYQRSRYRNPKGFALLQCDLVRKQVDRLQHWGGVTDWIVKVRKREEVRLNRENAEIAAGRHLPDDGEGEMSMDTQGSRIPGASGSPRWLVQCTGPGKSTGEVLEILNRIEQDIAETGSNFPDVEILPNVVAEMARPSSSASTSSRGHMVTDSLPTSPSYGPPRSQMEGGGMYEAELAMSPHQRAAIEAERERKRKASMTTTYMGNGHPAQRAALAERRAQAPHHPTLPPLLPENLVKRQRTGQMSDDDADDDAASAGIISPHSATGYSPPHERLVFSQELPERIKGSTVVSSRPILPSIHNYDHRNNTRRGPTVSSYMNPAV